jgi:hypothetical protein
MDVSPRLSSAQGVDDVKETETKPFGFTFTSHSNSVDRKAVLVTLGLVLAVVIIGAVITGIALSQPLPPQSNIVKIDI